MAEVKIIVTDPQKIGEGMSSYVSYKVASTFAERPAGADNTSYTVVRRFNDFLWLRHQLRDTMPYLIVPSLPEKQQLGRFNAEFIDVRHRALQRFMQRISAHRDMALADATIKFLTLPHEALTALREASSSAGATVRAAAGATVRGFNKVVKVTSNVISGSGSSSGAAMSKSAEDLSFQEVEAYLVGQAPLVATLYNAAAMLAGQYRIQAQLLLEYGGALRSLGAVEGGALGAAEASAGLAIWGASTVAYEQAAQETELFVEDLADYVRGASAVNDMISERSKASASLADALAHVEHLRAQSGLLQSNPTPANAQKRAVVESELLSAQVAVTDGRAYYDRCAASVIAELERYRAAMRVDFKAMFTRLLSTQARASTKLEKAWSNIADSTNAAVLAEGAQPFLIAEDTSGLGGSGAADYDGSGAISAMSSFAAFTSSGATQGSDMSGGKEAAPFAVAVPVDQPVEANHFDGGGYNDVT